MKVSKIAKGKRAKSSVFRGTKVKTVGGLKKSDLIRNKRGKIVSRKSSEAAKKKRQEHRQIRSSREASAKNSRHQGISGCWWKIAEGTSTVEKGPKPLQEVNAASLVLWKVSLDFENRQIRHRLDVYGASTQ